MQVRAVPPDAVAAFNYGLDKVRFLAPVKSGARVRLRVTVIGVERKTDGSMILKTGNTLEIEGSDNPAFNAESLALVFPHKAAKSEQKYGPVETFFNMLYNPMTKATHS